MTESINFPNLGIHLEHVGQKISVFGFDIAYYGMIIGIRCKSPLFRHPAPYQYDTHKSLKVTHSVQKLFSLPFFFIYFYKIHFNITTLYYLF